MFSLFSGSFHVFFTTPQFSVQERHETLVYQCQSLGSKLQIPWRDVCRIYGQVTEFLRSSTEEMSLSAASERVPSAPSAPSAPPAPSAASHSLKSLHIQQFSEISEQPALHEWMQLIHTALKQIQTSTANQCLMIQDLQSSVAAQSAALHAVGLGSISETSETPSQLAVHASEIPPSAPREEENVKKQRKCQSDPLGSLSMAKQSQLRESKRENRLNFELPNSLGLHDLEDLNANQLLSGFRPIRPGKRHPSALLVPCPSSPLQSPEALEAFGEPRPKSLNSKTRGGVNAGKQTVQKLCRNCAETVQKL